MRYLNYIPILLAALMYGAATYLVLDMYISIADGIGIEESIYIPLAVNLASYLFLSGSVLTIGFIISDALRKK